MRTCSQIYAHGHSAGDSNPTPVETMHAILPTMAFDVKFNRFTAENRAGYFCGASDLRPMLDKLKPSARSERALRLKEIFCHEDRWNSISSQYVHTLIPARATGLDDFFFDLSVFVPLSLMFESILANFKKAHTAAALGALRLKEQFWLPASAEVLHRLISVRISARAQP